MRLEGVFKGQLVQFSLQPPRAGNPRTHPDRFWISQGWRLHSLSWPLVSGSSEILFPDAPTEPLVFQVTPTTAVPASGQHWKQPVCILFLRTLSPWACSSSGWTVPALSASPYRRDAPLPSWPLAALSPVCPWLSCIRESRSGHRAPGVASPPLRRGNRWCPFTSWQQQV